MSNIPLYIISFNRVGVLQETIASVVEVIGIENIIIIDNDSDYPPLMELYTSLELQGAKVIKNKKLRTPEDLNSIAPIIEAENAIRQCDYYIVSDPDISLKGVPQDFLTVYKHFLDAFKEVQVVGPMLRITDIPIEYPTREYVWRKHANQFWKKEPLAIEINRKKVHYQFARIDTTFGMLRSETVFKRMLKGVRVYEPYDASHLDWYIDPNQLSDDQQYYLEKTRRSNISHWGGRYLQGGIIDEVLKSKERTINIVENGEIVKFKLPNHATITMRLISWMLKGKRRLLKLILRK